MTAGTYIFSNFADQRLYRQRAGGSVPEPLTPAPLSPEHHFRYSDGVLDQERGRWIGVREDHTGEGEPVNTIVSVDLDWSATAPGRVLAGGHDFFCSPRLSPDGTRIVWLAWDHPNMPWNGTTLYLADMDADGAPADIRVIAGGVAELVFQPEWSPDGDEIIFVSDRSGWWNPLRFRGSHRGDAAALPDAGGVRRPAMEFWHVDLQFRWPRPDRMRLHEGGPRPTRHVGFGERVPMHDRDWVYGVCFDSRRWRPRRVSRRCLGSADIYRHARLAVWATSHLQTGDRSARPHRTAYCQLHYPGRVDPISDHRRHDCIRIVYPPRNPDCVGSTLERPPLLVECHGGPTSSASSTLNFGIQFWTSRGFAVVDVDYGGSTGYGRAYRERLQGNGGVVDVDDCVNAASSSWPQGEVDGRASPSSGGSAGGYTTLCALAFRDVFPAGASHYGVADLSRARPRHPQVRVALPRLAHRTLSGRGGALSRAFPSLSRRPPFKAGNLFPGI